MGAIALIAAIALVAVAGATAVDGSPSTFQVDVRDGPDYEPMMVFTAPEGETFSGVYSIAVMDLTAEADEPPVYQITTASIDSKDSFFIQGAGISSLESSKAYLITMTQSGGDTVSVVYYEASPVVTLSIDGTEGSGSINDGETSSITVEATPSGIMSVAEEVVWTSSPAGVVQISGGSASGCTIQALQPGECTITMAFTINGVEYTGEYDLTVNKVGVTSVSVSSSDSKTSVDPGEQLSLTATVSPNNASYPGVTWSSSNESIATVSEGGVVTGIAPGSVTITATADGVSGTFSVTVNAIPVQSISIQGDGSVMIGGTSQLTCVFTPTNATNKNVNWESSDDSIATVSGSGVVTGVKVGSATITATSEDGSKTATLSVTVNAVAVTGISITDAPQTLRVGDVYTIKYAVSPDGATTQTVSWTSSNQSVLSVSSQGVVTAHSVSEEPVTITVSITDEYGEKETFTASVNISVVPVEVPSHTITIVCGDGGVVTPSGDLQGKLTIVDGGNQTLTVTPSSGFEIDTVLVDGAEVQLDSDNQYTFSNVTGDHTFSVTFVEVPTPVDPDEPDHPVVPPYDDDDYVPLPPHIVVEENGDDDSKTVVACAAAAVAAVLIALVMFAEYRKR